MHHVGTHSELEDQMCNWVPGVLGPSPDRMDALVWATTEVLLEGPISIWSL
jgi:phage terminase large subunit-like protein